MSKDFPNGIDYNEAMRRIAEGSREAVKPTPSTDNTDAIVSAQVPQEAIDPEMDQWRQAFYADQAQRVARLEAEVDALFSPEARAQRITADAGKTTFSPRLHLMAPQAQ